MFICSTQSLSTRNSWSLSATVWLHSASMELTALTKITLMELAISGRSWDRCCFLPMSSLLSVGIVLYMLHTRYKWCLCMCELHDYKNNTEYKFYRMKKNVFQSSILKNKETVLKIYLFPPKEVVPYCDHHHGHSSYETFLTPRERQPPHNHLKALHRVWKKVRV